MSQESKEPRSPVPVERAMDHGLLTIRRAWAGGVPDFEGWGGYELDPEPLVIHDLNGQVLFYEFGVMKGRQMVGSIRASASKIIGSAIPAVQLGPRRWDPGKAAKAAQEKVKKRFPRAEVTETELVCYSYPKIGVRVYIMDPESKRQSLILDVGDLSFVERYGADELEGFTSWSFYEVAERNASARERWELVDRELEAARSATPRIFESGFTAAEMADLREMFIPSAPEWKGYVKPIPLYSLRTIRFSPRCNTHECFELCAQKFVPGAPAAVGQMILDFYRYYYTQDEIAAAMGSGPYGTSIQGMMDGIEQLSKYCLTATRGSTANWAGAKAKIDANQPLVSFVPGHARACAGWKRENLCIWPGPCKRWLKIYDSWPPNEDICKGGSIYWEDWDTVVHANFIYVRHRTTACP